MKLINLLLPNLLFIFLSLNLLVAMEKSPELPIDEQLMKAVKLGNYKKFRKLIEKGADYNACSPRTHYSLLQMALSLGHQKIANFLLKKDADCTDNDIDGGPCEFSFINTDVPEMKILFMELVWSKKVDLLVVDKNENNIFHHIATTGKLSWLKWVLGLCHAFYSSREGYFQLLFYKQNLKITISYDKETKRNIKITTEDKYPYQIALYKWAENILNSDSCDKCCIDDHYKICNNYKEIAKTLAVKCKGLSLEQFKLEQKKIYEIIFAKKKQMQVQRKKHRSWKR